MVLCMCGRFAMNQKVNDLITEFVAGGGRAEDWAPAYSIAPTNRAPIIREHRDDDGITVRDVELGKWDFIAPGKPAAARLLINTRMEKLADRFWVGAFSNYRCIVPMLGYYEWTGPPKDKQPHFIHGDELLAAAGVYSRHQDEKTGHWRSEFAIVTREARDASGEVHDRMPAFLSRDLWHDWLNPESLTVKNDTDQSRANREELIGALGASSTAIAATITTYEVDRRVNNHRAIDPRDPDLITPIEESA